MNPSARCMAWLCSFSSNASEPNSVQPWLRPQSPTAAHSAQWVRGGVALPERATTSVYEAAGHVADLKSGTVKALGCNRVCNRRRQDRHHGLRYCSASWGANTTPYDLVDDLLAEQAYSNRSVCVLPDLGIIATGTLHVVLRSLARSRGNIYSYRTSRHAVPRLARCVYLK